MLGHPERETQCIADAFRSARYVPSVTHVSATELRAESVPGYDIVVSDFECARLLKASSWLLDGPPWIVVADQGGEALEQSAIQAGAQEYLALNQLGRLGHVVKRVLERDQLRRTEQRTRQSESDARRSLALALKTARMGVWEWELETNVLHWSPECLEMIGLATFDATFEDYYKLLSPVDADRLKTVIESALAKRESFSVEVRLNRPDRKTCWLWNSGQFDEGHAGIPGRFVGIVQDVTERVTAQHTLAESESRLKAAQRMAGLGVWEWDFDQTIWWSEEVYRIAGYDPRSIVPTREECLRVLPDEAQSFIRTAVRESIDSNTSYRLKHQIRRADGELRWLDSFGTVERACDGTPVRLWGICKDITDQQRVDNDLRESEQRFRESEMRYAAISEITRSVTFAGRFSQPAMFEVEWVRPRYGMLSGYTDEDLKRDGWGVLFHPDDHGKVLQLLNNASQGRIDRNEARLITKSGKQLIVLMQVMLFERGPGVGEGLIVGGILDITAIKAIEVALRTSEERFQLALRGANEGLWDLDLERKCIFYSPRWKSILGYRDEEVSNEFDTWLELVHPEDRSSAREHLRSFLKSTQENYESEFRMRHKSGEYRDILSRGFVNRDAQGRPTRMVGTHQDITERKQADEELRASRQRLEVLSRQLITTREAELRHLARELHDEIGQGLTATKMNLRAIQMSVSEQLKKRLEESVSLIDHTVDQVRNLSLNMRPPHLDDLGLAATLHWYLKQQAKIGGFVDHLSVTPPDLVVPTDLATVCYRITQEAVTNAMRHAGARQIEIQLREADGELTLKIQDDGAGFNVAAARERAAEGNSLGLISMQERANLADGQFEIVSEPAKGTTVFARFRLTRS
ncbi:PAS domain-containing sensor histidine kinase [Schlesneria paludicola]|uniref:PAS domain-containing sensor histidine kinase n=1 Tax=Schlesneria paludicola TaxID=360056 RepID=UPI00029B50B0|nr:PAS domain-containing protein [Schlesneria paludicola]